MKHIVLQINKPEHGNGQAWNGDIHARKSLTDHIICKQASVKGSGHTDSEFVEIWYFQLAIVALRNFGGVVRIGSIWCSNMLRSCVQVNVPHDAICQKEVPQMIRHKPFLSYMLWRTLNWKTIEMVHMPADARFVGWNKTHNNIQAIEHCSATRTKWMMQHFFSHRRRIH